MPEIELSFIHPTDGRIIRVSLDDALTGEEVVEELIHNAFLQPSKQGYLLTVKGGDEVDLRKSFAQAGIRGGEHILIRPVSEAGGRPTEEQLFAIPGVRRSSGDRLTVQDIQQSPAAVIMLAHMHDDLQRRFDSQARMLEYERLRSENRFSASLILLISQLVLALGVNLLTQNESVAALVLAAGGLQAALALYLTFRKPKLRSFEQEPGREQGVMRGPQNPAPAADGWRHR